MAKIFQIVSSAEKVALDKEGKGELTFVVTNLAQSVAGRVVLVPLEETDEGWLSVEDGERELSANQPEEFKLAVEVPGEVPPGEHRFRIDVVSELNPDEDFSEGPTITLTKAAPSRRLWWILLAVSLVVLIALVGVLLVVMGGGKDGDGAAEGSRGSATEALRRGGGGDRAGAGGGGAGTRADAAGGGGSGGGGGTPVIGFEAPNLMGLSPGQAVEKAESLGLVVEPSKWLELACMTVGEQVPRPGGFVAEGGTISLGLRTLVPSLVGRELSEAEELLQDAGLSRGKISLSANARQEPGRVSEQSAAPKMAAPAGTSIDLTIAQGPCSWTNPFSSEFGPMNCRRGAAAAGFSCVSKSCAAFQVYCCPYLPWLDEDSVTKRPEWKDTARFEATSSKTFLDGFEFKGRALSGGRGFERQRARSMRSPSFERGTSCGDEVSAKGFDYGPLRCASGHYLTSLTLDSSQKAWKGRCCSMKVTAFPE
ncbi:MAG: PASTA domain-containing protein [Acidobacteriota bacterium]